MRVLQSTSTRSKSNLTSTHTNLLQRKCACDGTAGPIRECEECRKKRLQQKRDQPRDGRTNNSEVPPIVHEVLRSPGQGLDAQTRAFMEPRFGHDFSYVRVHSDSQADESARAVNANAYTVGRHIILNRTSAPEFSAAEQQLLAHELAHVVQQKGMTPEPKLTIGAAGSRAEREADLAAEKIIAGSTAAPRVRAGSSQSAEVQRDSADKKPTAPRTPYDTMIVARAKKRLELLNNYVTEYTVREARRLRSKSELDKTLGQREKMDLEGDNPFAEFERRGEMEKHRIAALNKRPLEIDVTETEVKIKVRFQVRFEDPTQDSKFGQVKSTLEKGINQIWNQTLKGDVFGGRKFTILPEVVKVGAQATRDLNYWLITVRPTDSSPVAYTGCQLDQPPPGAATSVTEPSCDGGIMSIPPSHISLPDILGHELLHLFGFVDRYLMQTIVQPGQKPRTVLQSTRKTEGRADPLGSESGQVLSEDIAFLFDNLGIYEMEQNRGLETLRSLEKQGLNLAAVQAEIHRQQEIIQAGRDPHSLIPTRPNFTDVMIKQTEDL
jgi:hypothetical protein